MSKQKFTDQAPSNMKALLITRSMRVNSTGGLRNLRLRSKLVLTQEGKHPFVLGSHELA